MPASGASLLLNAEGVFTALLAWFAFKENFDRRDLDRIGQRTGYWHSQSCPGACRGHDAAPLPNLAGALALGFLAYGLSLALSVIGPRHPHFPDSHHRHDH
ncbi:hypothetical protein D3C78_1687090 [compost metagenome]